MNAEARPHAKPTQTQRLLRHARNGNPLDQLEWFSEAPDGLGPITALRSRVADLQRQGHHFRHVPRRGSLHVYWLLDDGGAAPEHTSAVALTHIDDGAEPLALELPPAEPTSAYDLGSEWA